MHLVNDLARWILAFQSYDFIVHHRPGVIHQNADALSRLVSNNNTSSESLSSITNNNHDELYDYDETEEENDTSQERLEIVSGITDETNKNNSELLYEQQQADTDLQIIYQLLMKMKPTTVVSDSHLSQLQKLCSRNNYQINNNLVCVLNRGSLLEKPKYVPVIPSSIIKDVLDAAHNNDLAGHCGESTMYRDIRQRCFWPNLSLDITNYVRRCHKCQLSKSKPSANIPSLPLPIPSRPFEIVGMDAMAMPTTSSGNNTLLVFTDYLTRWPEAVAVKCKKAGDPTAEQVARALIDVVISRHGLPLSLLSDKGKAFCEGTVAKLLEYLGINKLQTSPYHPQCNGLTERFNRTFTGIMKQLNESGLIEVKEWDTHLSLIMFAARSHFNRNSKKSAFHLLYGRDPVVPINAAIGYTDQRFASRDEYIRELVRSLPSLWKFVTENMEVQAKLIHARNQEMIKQINYNYSKLVIKFIYMIIKQEIKRLNIKLNLIGKVHIQSHVLLV